MVSSTNFLLAQAPAACCYDADERGAPSGRARRSARACARAYPFQNATSDPILTRCASANPAGTSSTYLAGVGGVNVCGNVLGETENSMYTTRFSLEIQIISIEYRISRIQKECWSSRSNTNNMPSLGARCVVPPKPRSRSCGVSATAISTVSPATESDCSGTIVRFHVPLSKKKKRHSAAAPATAAIAKRVVECFAITQGAPRSSPSP